MNGPVNVIAIATLLVVGCAPSEPRFDWKESIRRSGASVVSGNGPNQLESVVFIYDRIDAETIDALCHAESVRKIDFNANRSVDDACLEGIRKVAGVEDLNIGGTPVSATAVARLNAVPSLRRLFAWRTATDDLAIHALAKLDQLEQLNLWDTPTTDACLTDFVTGYPALRVVYLGNSPQPNTEFHAGVVEEGQSQITVEGVARLHRLRPDLEVVFWSAGDRPEAPLFSLERLRRGLVENRVQPSAFGETEEWSQFLGGNANGHSNSAGLRLNWTEYPPNLNWQLKCGEGLSAPSFAGNRLVITDRSGDFERVLCADVSTGKLIWSTEFETRYKDALGYNNGPRSTPAIVGNQVVTVSADGILRSLALSGGEVQWERNLLVDFNVVPNLYGVGSSPYIYRDMILFPVGGFDGEKRDAGVVAFSIADGSVRYQLSDFQASYASIRVANLKGRHVGFAFMREGLVAFEADRGLELARWPWAARVSGCVNGATPVVDDGRVFLSEAYGPGSVLLRMDQDHLEPVWRDPKRSRKRAMRAHWATPILCNGCLFGCSGRASSEAELRCIDFETGAIRWSHKQRMLSSLVLVDGHLINVTEDGAIELIAADSAQFTPIARYLPTEDGGSGRVGDSLLLKYPVWAAPVVVGGNLYVRGSDRLACFSICDSSPHTTPVD